MTKMDESGVSAKGSSELPVPTFEGDEAVSLPEAKNDIAEQLKKIQARIEDMDRRWQQDKDRRIPKLEERLDGLQNVLADYDRLVKGGVDANVAQWLLERLDTRVGDLDKQSAQSAQPSTQGREAPSDAASAAIGKLAKYGLQPNEPAFIELLRGRYRNTDAFNAAVNEYILERAVPGNTISRVAVSQGTANEESVVEPENPISNIEDAKKLYSMAYADIVKKKASRGR